MKPFPNSLVIPVLTIFLSIGPAPFAQEKELDPYEWVIETYSFPAYDLVGGFASEERGALKPPSLPKPDATDEEIQDFIKKSNSVVSHFLDMQGISFPKGSLVLFDPESLTLTTRLPRIAQSSVAFTSDAYLDNVDMLVDLQPTIIEAPADSMREKLAKIGGIADHSEILSELEEMVADGEATLINQSRMQCRSGQRTKIEQLRETAVPIDLALSEDGLVEYEADLVSEGTTWETDPVVGSDGETLDLNIAVNHNFAPGKRIQKPLTANGDTEVTIAQTETFEARVTSQYTMLSGTARLLGVWKPEISPGDDQNDVLQAAFVRNELLRVLPLPNSILEQYLRNHGEAILPIPEGDPEFEQVAEEIPEGMIVRRYVIPPTFLTASGSGGDAAVDPFADPIDNEPRFAIRATAKDILQSAGISFPAGSSANYIRQTSTLVIRNTPEQIQLVDAYLSVLRSGVEKAIALTLHIVEGPGDLIREAERNTRGIIDHRAEWARLQNEEDFSIVTTNWLEARSGQRAKVESTWNFVYPVSAFLRSKAGEEKGEENRVDHSTLSGAYETTPIGTTFEVDSVLGADEKSIDLNLAVSYHYAAPSIISPPAREEGKTALEGPITMFHRAEITSQIITLSGMIRMLGIWEPEGSAKFDNADILQAVFLKAEVVPLREDEQE